MDNQQPKENNAESGQANVLPVKTKRSARMLHESYYATSAFTSSRGQKRPPGFIASSLDYRPTTASATAASVTTKPVRSNKNNRQQHQEQQQQRQYRSGQSQPTRAQGNFGPPPHSVKTLEDLENMTEEEIYKLFMDDPELHETLMKSTQKENRKSSRPAGARKARSAGNKAKNKSNRNSAKTLKSEPVDREVPYFQWFFLLILVGAAIYQLHKSYSASGTTKDKAVGAKKAKGGKQKNKKGGKMPKRIPVKTKFHLEETTPTPSKKDAVGATKPPNKPLSLKKNKKKSSKSKAKTAVKDKEGKMQQMEKNQEPDLDSTDGSGGQQEPENETPDVLVQQIVVETYDPSKDEEGDDWKTVNKSSKGGKKVKATAATAKTATTSTLNHTEDEGNEELASASAEESSGNAHESNSIPEPAVVAEETNDTTKDSNETLNPSVEKPTEEPGFVEKKIKRKKKKNRKTGGDNKDSGRLEKDEKVSEAKSSEQSSAARKGEGTVPTTDDAALALQLHKQEISLARAAVGNPQEEEWEEVTAKKKKGVKV